MNLTLKEGVLIIKAEKNHPDIIVPADSRSRAFVKFLFSSPTGERDFNEALSRKQKNTIRNLYTAVNSVASILNIRPNVFRRVALVASSIRSFE